MKNSTDFKNFIKSLLALSDETSFEASSQDVKDLIAAFKVFFVKTEIDASLQKCINKCSKVVTKLYFKLLQLFHQYEPNHIQEFYCRWKEIVSYISSSYRAKSFTRYIGQFKLITNDLKDAAHRFEQMTIMKLLRLYTEEVTYDVLKAADNDNDIIEKIIEMGNEASLRKQHDFLDHMNVLGTSIITAKPTNVIAMQQSFTFCAWEYDMWIDFNLKDGSVAFIAVSLINEEDQCMAIVPLPQVKENIFMGNYVLSINGYWNLLRNNKDIRGGRKVKIMFVSPIDVQDMISMSKRVFKFSPFDYGVPNYEDADRNLNKMKKSYDSDTTICLPSISDSDTEEVSSEKSRIFGGAITEKTHSDFDSDEELSQVDWTLLQSNEELQELTCRNLRLSSADHMNCYDICTNNKYERDLEDKQELVGDALLNENQSENDEQFVNSQMRCNMSEKEEMVGDALFNENQSENDKQVVNSQMQCNMSEKVLQENNVSQPQRLEKVETCQLSTAQFFRQAKVQEDNVLQSQPAKVDPCPSSNAQSLHQANMQESNVLQPQQMEVNPFPQSTVQSIRLNRKRVLSTGRVTSSTFKENNGEISFEIRSRNFSVVEETVNDVIGKTNKRTIDSCHFNDKSDLTNHYGTRLRPRNLTGRDASRNINKSFCVGTTKRKRRKIRPTAATVSPKAAINVNSTHQVENDDSQNQVVQSLKAMTECRDQISQIHADMMRYFDQYIERLQSLLNNPQL